MTKLLAIAVAGALVILLLVFSTTYTVSFHEVAIVKTFGHVTPESVKTTPGLKLKWPIVQDKDQFDTRLQIVESPLEEVMLVDGQQVVAKAFLLWSIDTSSPEATISFAEAYPSIETATEELRSPFVTAITGTLSEYRFNDLMGQANKLEEIEGRIQSGLAARVAGRGIVPVTVGLSQLLLPERATTSVIQRMEAIRTGLAEAVRQTGTAEAQAIESKAATEAELIRAFAEQRAADIRSTIDQRAATYMEKMGEERELATFLAWLDTLEATLSEQLTVFLDADTQPWHLMKLGSRIDEQGIPQDAGHWDEIAARASAEGRCATQALGKPEEPAPPATEGP